MHYAIRQAVESFARLDGVGANELPAFDKAIRNLSQRVYLPASAREGRADLYSLPAIAALRLVQKAGLLISDRWMLDRLAREMQNEARGGRRIAVEGGFRMLAPIQESIERTKEGEVVEFYLIAKRSGLFFSTSWGTTGASEAVFSSAGISGDSADALLTLPASHHIAGLLATLDADT